VEVVHPRWSAWSFLVYAGGLVILSALGTWLAYLASQSGDAGYAAWALLLLVLTAASAVGLHRAAHPVAAGVLASVAVIAWVAFLSSLWTWFGWGSSSSSSSFRGFHVAQLALELLWLLAAVAAVRMFRFPLLVAQVLLAGWLLVTDIVSNGGGWSAVVTLFVGVCYLGAGVVVDGGPRRPYGFWLQLGAGLLIGGALLRFWHGGNIEWTLIALASIAYVLFSQPTGRSSWAVLGAVGLLLASSHFALEETHVHLILVNSGSATTRPWVLPLVLTCLGLVYVALGLVLGRRSSGRTPGSAAPA
jgi:hypothetical protein